MLWLTMTQVDVPKVTKTEITKVTKWLKLWSKDAEEDTAEWCPFSKFKKQMGFWDKYTHPVVFIHFCSIYLLHLLSVSARKMRRVAALRDFKWLPNVNLQNIWGNYHLCGITERFRQSRLILVRRINQKEGFNQQLLSFIVINSKIRSW